MSVLAANIGIIPQSLVSDGQKTKTRLVPPRALHPDRNFAAWFCLPRLGSAPLTCYSVFTDVPSIPGNAAPRHKSFCACDSSSRMIHPGCHGCTCLFGDRLGEREAKVSYFSRRSLLYCWIIL